MKATDQLLTAVLILSHRAMHHVSLDETIRAFEVVGLVDHTYVQDKKGDVVTEYNFTPKFQALIEGI